MKLLDKINKVLMPLDSYLRECAGEILGLKNRVEALENAAKKPETEQVHSGTIKLCPFCTNELKVDYFELPVYPANVTWLQAHCGYCGWTSETVKNELDLQQALRKEVR